MALPDELISGPQHVRFINVALATGFDAFLISLQPLLPKRLFRDRVARVIWRDFGKPSLEAITESPITFTLQCAGDQTLYEVWINVKGRVYARAYVKRGEFRP